MVTIITSSNDLLPSPSFISQIITLRRSRSEVTIRWWPRRGVDKLILEGNGLIVRNCSRLPVCGLGFIPALEFIHHCQPQRSPCNGVLVGNSGRVVRMVRQQKRISCVLVGKHHKRWSLLRSGCRGYPA
ncbi:hypothetical protein O181_037054 [Austropuccinia psidii MF-1]|uniref:Uncharacterized protein n=1 Tax=Austropuccinia psidii MF-1 TaxID=1389203 RepID=A0A9Q3D5T7_9BASI|nr:hypothetical protein [Austropuccinia psidii MF-1]